MQLKKDLRSAADAKKAALLSRFFKTGKGEYGEGDRFLGVMVPQTRALVKVYWQTIGLADIKFLMESEWHEERLIALFILVARFKKSDDSEKEKICRFYLANTKFINNWDLVDLSAPNIVGEHLRGKDPAVIFKLARSKNMWERRIAILATFTNIKYCDSGLAMKIAEILVDDKHDLIQKAVGWMLREVGKRCGQDIEEEFLERHAASMPRTALRYAIERFDTKKRSYFMALRNN